MRQSNSPVSPPRSRQRVDGWTVERQLRFLDALARTGSVTAAARAAGMSRESAHRLRNRQAGMLFAALWDLALAAPSAPESHDCPLGDGQLMRLLGSLSRRNRTSFFGDAGQAGCRATLDRARTS